MQTGIGRILPGIMLCLGVGLSQSSPPYYAVGYVFDDDTGEPVAYVVIETKSGKELGKSNTKGRFEVEVESESALLIFKRFGYETQEVDLEDFASLIDIEVGLESSAKELGEMEVRSVKGTGRPQFKSQSVEELEQFQGMRIDLNDHLRELEGVSGMTEYTSDLSVYGSRTQDVTHYLGLNPIANMRHLDFGFPGNQSVLNPRVLRSVSLEDNMASGPINQGNASAIRYELEEGDPENITGDVVFGTINREFNTSFYWDSLSFVFSYRNLKPTFLANLGKQYFTIPKETRLGSCPDNTDCERLDKPIDMSSEDGLLSIYRRGSQGGYWRFFLLGASDDFLVNEDVADDFDEAEAQAIQSGDQRDLVGAVEVLHPLESGDLRYSVSSMYNKKENFQRDSSSAIGGFRTFNFYGSTGSSNIMSKMMGITRREDWTQSATGQWDPGSQILGGDPAYGLTARHVTSWGVFKDTTHNPEDLEDKQYLLTDGLWRMRWSFAGGRSVESSLGWHSVDVSGIYPMVSTHYTHPLWGMEWYGDVSLRQNTQTLPRGANNIDPVTTSSVEGKLGTGGKLGKSLTYGGSLYSRYYLEPELPAPEVYWHYEEQRRADYAAVFGANLNLRWEPSHHFGSNLNGSIVQGDYYLSDGSAIPWEANRSLDLVSHMRIVPRADSLLSFILTYSVNNDVPLYDYAIDRTSINKDVEPGQRSIRHSREYPYVSRQRTDLRINLNLKSKWKPMETARFYFQGNNIFADLDVDGFRWLGGRNEKQRGWTRIADWQNKPYQEVGDLTPVIIRGLGFYMMFGFEINFSI